MPARRAYIDGRYGQMHYRFSEPTTPSGKRPLMLFHMSPYSSLIYETFVQEMGRDRLAIAIDTPGFGASDLPPSLPEIADYAAAMGDVMDGLGLGEVDLMGYHTGSKIALAVAQARPQQVHRVVMVSATIFTDAELDEHRAMYAESGITDDGAHLVRWWQSARKWQMKAVSNEALQTVFAARVSNPETSWWGHRAAFNFQVKDELPKVGHPILVLNPDDDLVAFTPRAKPLLKHPESRVHDLPGWSHGFLTVHAGEAAALVRRFIDA